MNHREATVYVYSGTRNSRRVALWLGHAAAEAGCSVTLSPIESADPAKEVGHGRQALLGLVMPTHAALTHLYRRYHEPATTLKDLDRRQEWTSDD